jgi:hypothetical protein
MGKLKQTSSKKMNKQPKKAKAEKGIVIPRSNSMNGYSTGEALVLVDANNVRGASNPSFVYSLGAFVCLVSNWASLMNLEGRVVIMVDHGLTLDAFDIGSVHIIFAGPNQTADDLLVADVRGFTRAPVRSSSSDEFLASVPMPQARNIAVMTDDRELKRRVKRAQQENSNATLGVGKPSAGRVKTLGSGDFLAALERAAHISLPVMPPILARLDAAEDRLRKSHALPGRPQEAPASSLSVGVASGRPFREVTWHRVLEAEWLRRALEAARPCREPVIAPREPLAVPSAADLNCAALARFLADRSAGTVDVSLTRAEGGGKGAGSCNTKLEAYIARRRRLAERDLPSLLSDHRIIHDGAQKKDLIEYAQREMQVGHSEASEGLTEGEANVAVLESWLCSWA